MSWSNEAGIPLEHRSEIGRCSVLLMLVVAGCADAMSPMPGPGSGGEPTPAGAVLGAAVSAQIGVEGGVLASEDGALVVAVPAGAVPVPTTFSIQPVEGMAHGGVGRGYRLRPHGVEFAQKVRLTFRYDDAITLGTTPRLLRPAFQDSTGRWRLYRKPVIDTARREVSIETSHFSDWSLVAGARLMPGAATLAAGQSLELKVRECMAPEPSPTSSPMDSLVVPIGYRCHDAVAGTFSARNWSVNGRAGGSDVAGTIAPRTGAPAGTAVYTAPASAPAANPVAVSVQYSGMDPDASGILVSHVTVTDPPGQCTGLRNIAVWEGTLGVSYSFEGNKPNSPDHTRIDNFAEVHARLTRISDGPGGVTWAGVPTGLVRVNGRTVVHFGTEQRVTVVTAAGAPLPQPVLHEPSRVTLSVNLANCTYTVAFAAVTNGTVEVTNRAPENIEASTGSVRTVPRPVGGGTNLTAGADIRAHSPLWAVMNGGEAYIFSPFSGDVITAGYAQEGGAGTARVSWSFQPTQGASATAARLTTSPRHAAQPGM